LKPLPILLDTNLLLLLVVGMTNKTYIAKHKRLQAFTVEDYEVLGSILAGAPSVLLLPNTITETSNLAANIADPARTEIFFTFKRLIQATGEQYVESRVASERLEYLRLGLTDAAILEALADEVAVLTTDLELVVAAQAKGHRALNFNHIRDEYLT
jgi:hypothetical protein